MPQTTPARPRLPSAGKVAIALGGVAMIALVAWVGARPVAEAMLRAGWTLPPLLLLHAVQTVLSGLAWRALTGGNRPGAWTWVRIRWIRESANSLLPVAQIGGLLVGIRLLGQRGLALATGGAGTTLDLTVETLTQFLFTLLGIAALAMLGADPAWWPWLGGAMALMGLCVAGLILAQRAGMLTLVERFAARLSTLIPSLPAADMRGMHAELMRLQTHRGALLHAAALHMLAWLVGVGETWLALAAIGRPIGFAEALVIDSLGMAARSAGFMVPGALGVQEGGFLLVCGLFGVPAEAAVALSMLKRAREILSGLPGLLAWQWSEGTRLAARGSH